MAIIKPTEGGDTPVTPKEDIVSGTNSSLNKSLNLGDLLDEYNKFDKSLIEIRGDLRDTTDYKSEAILSQMFELAQVSGYTDIKISDKKIDKDGNIISIGLQGKSIKYGGCIGRLNFIRNCSYGEKGGSDETCIIEECYDEGDTSFEDCFDAEVVYKY
ncbi:MAG: hypothetical protein WAZ12_02805 [Candidatus Absconditicoccaceae bacterium]